MANTTIIIGAAVLLPLLLFFEKKDSMIGKLLTKTPLSILFIIAALVQPNPKVGYFGLLFAQYLSSTL